MQVQVNLPNTPELYERGNGEGVWATIDEATAAAYKANETGAGYTAVLDNDSWDYPGLEHGTEVPIELRGGDKRPVVPLAWLLERFGEDELERLRAAQRTEAEKRLTILKALGYEPEIINETGPVPQGDTFPLISERNQLNINGCEFTIGTLMTVDEYAASPFTRADIREVMNEFEQQHTALVYAITAARTPYGPILEFFYVSKWVEEWQRDRRELKEGNPVVYVVSPDDTCSEFGGIAFKCSGGGIVRTA